MKRWSIVVALICLTVSMSGCSKSDSKNVDADADIKGEYEELIKATENKSTVPLDVQNKDKTNNPVTPKTPDSSGIKPPEVPKTEFKKLTKSQIKQLSELDNTCKAWGQGLQCDDKNRPITCDPFNGRYKEYGGLAISDDTKTKNIMFTFDQGYENGYTPKILDALKEKKVQAIFFITMDYAKRSADLVQRMIDEGHIIGNHTDKHPSMPSVSIERLQQEIGNLDCYMMDNFGYKMSLLRPPKGEFSVRSMEETRMLGYKTIMWSFAYKDWDPNSQMDKNAAFKRLTTAAHPGGIYLLHSVSKVNAEILGDVIEHLKGKGYSFDITI